MGGRQQANSNPMVLSPHEKPSPHSAHTKSGGIKRSRSTQSLRPVPEDSKFLHQELLKTVVGAVRHELSRAVQQERREWAALARKLEEGQRQFMQELDRRLGPGLEHQDLSSPENITVPVDWPQAYQVAPGEVYDLPRQGPHVNVIGALSESEGEAGEVGPDVMMMRTNSSSMPLTFEAVLANSGGNTHLPIPVRGVRSRAPPSIDIESGASPSFVHVASPMTHTTNKSDCKSYDREEESRTWKQDLQQKLKTGLDEMKAGRHSSLPQMLPEIVRETPTARHTVRAPSQLEVCLEGGIFHAACSIVVLANALIIGFQEDFRARDALSAEPCGDPKWFQVADIAFLIFYNLEVLVRIAALRCRFFCGEEWGWNIYDFMLACYSNVAEGLTSGGVYNKHETHIFTYTPIFRVLRLVRIIRVLRVIRVFRFFRDLRLMTCSLIKTWVSLFWAFALLALFVYIWTILFVQVTTAYIADGNPEAAVQRKLQDYFGTVPLTMFTLFQAVSGGNDWYVFTEPLASVAEIYKYFFVLYVLFVLVGLLNVLTSVFVERAHEMSKLDTDLVIQGEMNSQQAFNEAMARVFQEVQDKNKPTAEDASNSTLSSTDRITWQMLRTYLEDEHARAYFATQQLDTWEARELFDHLEAGESGVTLEEFVAGCATLRGHAKNSHVATLLRETKRTRTRNEKVLKMLYRLKAEIQQLRTEATGQSPALYGPSVDISISDLCSPDTRRLNGPLGSTPKSPPRLVI